MNIHVRAREDKSCVTLLSRGWKRRILSVRGGSWTDEEVSCVLRLDEGVPRAQRRRVYARVHQGVE